MRCDGDGDDGADGGDDVDDDPDDAQRDGDDDDSDFSLPELFFSLSGFRLVQAAEKFIFDTPDVFRSKGSNTPKRSRRGATGARGGSLELASVPPFGSVTYSPKYCPPNFSGIFGASDVRYLDRYFSS